MGALRPTYPKPEEMAAQLAQELKELLMASPTKKGLDKRTVQEIILASREDTEPQDAILQYLKDHWHGKRLIGKRLIDGLARHFGAKYHFYLSTNYMTRLEVMEYPGVGHVSRPVLSMVLSHNTKHVVIDTDEIETRHEARLFGALKARNARREALAADPDACAELELLVLQYKDLNERVEDLLGGPFDVVRSEIKEHFNIRTRGDVR